MTDRKGISLVAVICFLFCLSSYTNGQTQPVFQIKGTAYDTSKTYTIPGAVAMAVRINDSVLVKFTRTDGDGVFVLKNLPIDTYQVIISHPVFSDGVYIVAGSKDKSEFDLEKVVLPPKDLELTEVKVVGFKDPIYFKGDTMIYTADSFKVKPNATVEDLLKKLPGMKVSSNGTITTQGKTVSKVLVDGDEFFGSDPTVATKNLNASNVESVQVYDKAVEPTNENAAEGETEKIINLKLKEEAKKGYFGKVKGASDFQKFYEGEFLANRFNKNTKISVFALAGNTPRTRFNWQDINQYGLDNERNFFSNDDQTFYFSNNNSNNGIPQIFKTGLYYTDKISSKTKILTNYSFNQNSLKATESTRNTYYLTDTTYSNLEEVTNVSNTKTHSVNLNITSNVDSLTEIGIRPKFSYGKTTQSSITANQFYTESEVLTRETDISNTGDNLNYSIQSNFYLKRNFQKKNRRLDASYDISKDVTDGSALLVSKNLIDTNLVSSNVDQTKNSLTSNFSHNLNVGFTEPFTKKLKLETQVDLRHSINKQDKEALNLINGEYTNLDSTFSNKFETKRYVYNPSLRLIYETKKKRFAIGSKFKGVIVDNQNLFSNTSLKQNVFNVLPFVGYRYRFSDNKSLSVNYNTSTNLPSINQIQPIRNNNNPNSVVIGNASLLPSFQHRVEFNFNMYKPISGRSIWSGINFTKTDRAFSRSTTYDNIGRTQSQTINVNGNYSGYGFFGCSLPFFDKALSIDPSTNISYSRNINYINGVKNSTTNTSLSAELEVGVEIAIVELSVNGNYDYTIPKTTLSNSVNKPYSSYGYGFNLGIMLPKAFTISTDATHTFNNQRTDGYNINYFIWNAELEKKFGKKENFILGIKAYDLLNQNISNQRTVNANIVTDTKTTIVKRYLLLEFTYKFNSNKEKAKDEEY